MTQNGRSGGRRVSWHALSRRKTFFFLKNSSKNKFLQNHNHDHYQRLSLYMWPRVARRLGAASATEMYRRSIRKLRHFKLLFIVLQSCYKRGWIYLIHLLLVNLSRVCKWLLIDTIEHRTEWAGFVNLAGKCGKTAGPLPSRRRVPLGLCVQASIPTFGLLRLDDLVLHVV